MRSFFRLLQDAQRYAPCRRRADVRLASAGALVFVGIALPLLTASFRRDEVTSRIKLRFPAALTLIAFVAFAVRVSYVITVSQHVPLGFDQTWYHRGWDTFGKSPGALFPPAYSAVLGAATQLGLETKLWHLIVTSALGTATVVGTGLLGRRFGGDVVGLVAAGGAAVYPVLFGADGALKAESLYAALVVTVLLLAMRAAEKPTLLRWALLGIVVGAAIMTRGEGVLLLPLLALPMALTLSGKTISRKVALLAATTVAVVAMLLPWHVRNYIVYDEPVILSINSATVIAGANCDETYSGDYRGYWVVDCLVHRYTPAELAGVGFRETTSNYRAGREGIRYAREHASELPALMVVRVLRTWSLYSPLKQLRFEKHDSYSWYLLGWLMHLALLPLAVYGGLTLRRRRARTWPLLAIIGMVTITSALTYGTQRWRVAAEPVVLVLASVGLSAVVAAALAPTRGRRRTVLRVRADRIEAPRQTVP